MKLKEILFSNNWITPYLKRYKSGLVLAVFLGTLTMLFAGLLMFSSGYVISKSASKPENILMIYVPVLMVRVFGIGRPVLRYVERLTSHNWILKITSELRKKLYLRLEKSSVTIANKLKIGDLLGILNEDLANLQDLYLRTIFPVLIAGTLSLSLLIASAVVSLSLALGIAIFFGIALVAIPLFSYKWTVEPDTKLKKYRNDLFSDLTDDILGLQDWTLSGRKDDFLKNYRQAEENTRSVQKGMFSFTRKRGLVLQFVYAVLVVFLLIWSGLHLTSGESLNYIAAISLMAFPLFDAYGPLSEAIVETQRYGDSVQRLNDLPDSNEAVRTEQITDDNLTISHLDFSFDEGQTIFKDLNLEIKKGEHVVILGRSGVGKSTLASLVRGDLAPVSGSIRFGAVEPSKANNVEHKIGVINQNPYLFNATVRSNLTLANLDATDEQIWDTLELVGLKKMIENLPKKLDQWINEAGSQFSGGERQRLALARILLSNAEVIILDEPTVSLDPITENQLLKLFFERLKGKTILFITHHLLGIQQMDRVIFLEDGKIKIDGSPEALISENEDFRRLYQLDQGL
ncbi:MULTISPECIES: thiol reductant ABC exporter subunit CydC [unclassified Lactococcus]|uniref:thiol reductant ABC exporter subunit CydC n=1 Tax=unclassified Lactococcus TaxID=2643510 RepID=UPI0011C7AA2B|nr:MULTISPECIES: thiol reductant ABC exporter subunit CydC [unclassified Lactococcus]MQW22183.1 thiol reductant ABC exporter subunit CydC [Lactococcus sp. dk101]TXK45117.1 thiol reductant ABC exporter subunit CydC [Lactococcus sp. dk310]TXK51103.1 thiol reductant ABC exporter subunit CydC [Lactococcus sp. dk322]